MSTPSCQRLQLLPHQFSVPSLFDFKLVQLCFIHQVTDPPGSQLSFLILPACLAVAHGGRMEPGRAAPEQRGMERVCEGEAGSVEEGTGPRLTRAQC